LGPEGLILAYRAFVRPVAEYGSALMMGASATQLYKLDHMRHLAEQLYSTQFIPLERRRHAAAIGLLCKSQYWTAHVVSSYHVLCKIG